MGRGNLIAIIALAAIAIALALPMSAAQSGYYADIEISVGSGGDAAISGLTNHPSLGAGTYSQYTSKKGDFWLFNFSIDDEFLAYTYTVSLPENAEINYVKTATQFRIGADGEKPFVKGTGDNAPLQILIQYSLGPTDAAGFMVFGIPFSTFVIVILAIIVLIGILYYLWKHGAFARKARPSAKRQEQKAAWYNKALLPPRQRQIIEMLEESGKPITQKQIESHSSLPKSSLSRNIDALVKKGILKKEPHGMSNIIYISEEPPKVE